MSTYVWTPEAEERVTEALNKGWTQQRIADAVGCHLSNINEVKRRIELRKLNANPLCVKLTDDERQAKKNALRVHLRMAMGVPFEDAAKEVIEGVKETND